MEIGSYVKIILLPNNCFEVFPTLSGKQLTTVPNSDSSLQTGSEPASIESCWRIARAKLRYWPNVQMDTPSSAFSPASSVVDSHSKLMTFEVTRLAVRGPG